MALVPAVVRTRLLTRAMVRGGAVPHLLAFGLQPAAYLKRMSMRRGLLGSSLVWKVAALFVYSPSTFQRLFGKSTEVLDVSRLGPDRFMHVTTATPMTRRRRRKLARSGVDVPTLKDQKAYGRLWAAKADTAKRAS